MLAWRTSLINYVKDRIINIEGDFLEFGTFLADLTVLLAELAKQQNKKLISVDVCDFLADTLVTSENVKLSDYYKSKTRGKKQKIIIKEKLQVFDNVDFIKTDSVKIQLLENRKFSLVVVDGGHQTNVFKHDARLGWSRLSFGGILAIHDYKGNIPGLTEDVDEIVEEFGVQQENVVVLPGLWIVLEKN